MELDRMGGNGVDYKNTGSPNGVDTENKANEYEMIRDPDNGYRHTEDPGAIYTLPEPSTASTGPRDTADPGAIYTLPEPSTASTGPRDTADPGAIYTLPEPSTASTGPRDSQPANSPPTERPRGETVQHKAVHRRRRCAYILVPGIGMIILAGILGYLVWKVSKQNEQIIELAHEIQVKDQTSSTVLADPTTHDVTTEAAFVPYNVTPVMSVTQPLLVSRGVAIHPHTGDVCVPNLANNALCIFSGRTYDFISCTHEWQTPNNTVISLSGIQGIAITPDGSIILRVSMRIIMIENGVATKSWGSGQVQNALGEFNGIMDIAIDDTGLIYVSYFRNSILQVIDTITSDIRLLSQEAIHGYLRDITINPVNKDILVITADPLLVLVLDDRGRPKRNVSLSYKANGLFVDRRGYIFITTYDAVHIYDPMWHEVQSFGRYGSCSSCFNNPHVITVNSQNENLLVKDYSNNRIQVFRKTTRP